MAEHGINLAHTTILRWVQRYIPEFEKKWNRFAHPVGIPWRVNETYIRVRGEWKYLYRAVDKQGNTVDFLLSEHRDIAAAKRFFTRAIEKQGVPEKAAWCPYENSKWPVGVFADRRTGEILPPPVITDWDHQFRELHQRQRILVVHVGRREDGEHKAQAGLLGLCLCVVVPGGEVAGDLRGSRFHVAWNDRGLEQEHGQHTEDATALVDQD